MCLSGWCQPESPLTAPSLLLPSWKGENVATTEVEATLALVSFIQEVNVYGVAVPGESHQNKDLGVFEAGDASPGGMSSHQEG